MLIILAIVMSVGALLIVAYPIIAKGRGTQPATSSAQEELDELLARRDAAFQALRDLNFDHRVGKVSDEDFVVFEANLKEGAAASLQALDAWESATDVSLDPVLERAIEARRATLAAALLGSERSCPACGRPAFADDKFCAACGTALAAEKPQPALAITDVCPKCGRPSEPGDRFCGNCGAVLPGTPQMQAALPGP
jgi:Double zinc ribbon